jgi:DegV family protein with EDD domain
MDRIGIVCDSTCDLGPEWLSEHDVVMVPLKVTFGSESFLDWVELTPSAFYEKLAASDVLPKTSQPSPADFVAVYNRQADEGCTGIVSVHLSSPLSGTIESATMAAKMVTIPVRVVDTLTVSAAEALSVDAAINARDAGLGLDGVEAATRAVAERSHLYFALDTLDYLVKGGRAGKAQGLAASLLNIKPVLTINDDGIIEPFKKAKGMKKAIAEMAASVAEASQVAPLRLILLHAQAPDLVENLTSALDAAGAHYRVVHTVSVGAVIGTYAGPRAIGVAFAADE